MPKIKCSCGYAWNYRGKAKKACCPQCGNKNTVATHREDSHRRRSARGPMPSNYTIEGLRSLLQEASKENEELDVIIEDLTNEVDYLKQRLSNQNYSSDGGNNVEARLLEEMMRAPAGTDEHTNRQLENAQRKVIELRDKLKIAENKLKEAGLA